MTKFYMPSQRCKRGHLAKRYVSTGGCVRCVAEAAIRQKFRWYEENNCIGDAPAALVRKYMNLTRIDEVTPQIMTLRARIKYHQAIRDYAALLDAISDAADQTPALPTREEASADTGAPGSPHAPTYHEAEAERARMLANIAARRADPGRPRDPD